jgi:hypothetical protein
MQANQLINEKSPYLLQHAYNPVDWRPWGEEAFADAKRQQKPIFLSIGYSTCHWCHVMERESFESEVIAEVLNSHFIPIKVDREERPDVDRVYMLFVQATTGSGGWPMSVWLTPDLEPFYGGTYFPPDNRYGRPGFRHVLEQIAVAWRQQREKLVSSAREILSQLEAHQALSQGDEGPDAAAIDSCYYALRRSYDSRHGGFGGAPKFPRPAVFNLLFRYWHKTGEEDAREMALKTLREMARGGMNDQLGGGFHRYSVDERWFVPHFEKMLYDQAQLAAAYLEAYQISCDEFFARVARDVFEYVLRDLRHREGGFFSAEDADSAADASRPHEKGEGAFYIWPMAELESLLGTEKAARFAAAYGCEKNGNVSHDPHGEFGGRNILFQAGQPDDSLEEAREVLLEARGKRPRPHLDDKVLAAWNGMMISALARGAQVLDPLWPEAANRYLAAARDASSFVARRMFNPATALLLRRWRDGEAAIEGFLDDYAAFALAQVDLYETTLDPSHLELAAQLARAMLLRFEDKENGGFYSSAEGAKDLVLRLKEDYDGAEPSGNSLAAELLLRLGAYLAESDLIEAAQDTLAAFSGRLRQQAITMPQMICALMRSQAPKTQLVVSKGEGREALLNAFRSRFRPFAEVYEPGALDGRHPELKGMHPAGVEAEAWLCENFTCQAPVKTAGALASLLD